MSVDKIHGSQMDWRRVKVIVAEMVDLIAGCTPPEYQAALTMATAVYFKANFPNDLEETFRMHGENLRAALEELDKNPVLDLTGIDLTGLKDGDV